MLFISAVLGVFLFKDMRKFDHGVENYYMSFKNLFYSCMTLFKCSTADNWSEVMFTMMNKDNCIYSNDNPKSACYTSTFFTMNFIKFF